MPRRKKAQSGGNLFKSLAKIVKSIDKASKTKVGKFVVKEASKQYKKKTKKGAGTRLAGSGTSLAGGFYGSNRVVKLPPRYGNHNRHA